MKGSTEDAKELFENIKGDKKGGILSLVKKFKNDKDFYKIVTSKI
jgi:hypothetical protein